MDGRTPDHCRGAKGASRGHALRRHSDVNAKDKVEPPRCLRRLSRVRRRRRCPIGPATWTNARGKNGITALASYVWRDNKDAATELIKRGADVNLADDDGDTPLHGAAQTGNVEVMQLLLEKSANPNARNSVGGTPLMWAAVYNNEEAAKLLLKAGADPLLQDNDGETAAAWATKNEHQDLAQYLKSAKRLTRD